MSLKSLDRRASPAALVDALRDDGAVVVRELARPGLVDAVIDELRPALEASGEQHRADYQSGFSGRKTLRCHGVLGYAPACSELIAHEAVLAAADALLLPSCAEYQLGSTTGIEILPGEIDQQLHRDDSAYPIQRRASRCRSP